MDGTSNDNKKKGSLYRLASLSQALDQYAPMILDMISRKARVTTHSGADGIYDIIIYGREGRFWTLKNEDYDKCLSIARKFSSPVLFPSSPESTLDVIRSYISVEFAGRV
jgi:hypothetical protein